MDEEKETKKVTMKESELEELVGQKVENKLGVLADEIKASLGEYGKAQLDEQLKDALSKIKVGADPGMEEAEAEAKKFKSFSEFLVAIKRYRNGRGFDDRLAYVTHDGKVVKQAGDVDSVLKTAGHMQEGDDAQGGFLVPEVYRADLQVIALENAVVRPRGPMVIPPIKTDSVKIPYVNDTSHATTVFGGVQASWTAEKAEKTPTKPTFGQMELTPHKLAGITYTSNELLADSAIALEPLIKRLFGSAWGYFEDNAFLNGTGVGQPQGILSCPGLKTVFRNTVNRVMLEDLAEMYANMLPTSHSYAYWVINPGVIPELIELGTGNAADISGKNLIWINSSGGATEAPPMKILGRPVVITEKVPALGTQGDIGYFDFRYYIIFDRQPITIDVSTHVGFTTDETCWRFVLRVDGQCWPASTITIKNAGAPVTSISPFVVLAATTS